MKQLMVLSIILGLGVAAYAGPGPLTHHRNRGGRTVVVVTQRPVYRPYYSPYSSLNWGFRSPYYGYSPYWGMNNPTPVRETKADLAVQEVRNDYGFRISEVRHDKSMSKQERKAMIRQLKHERDQAIIEAKRKYY